MNERALELVGVAFILFDTLYAEFHHAFEVFSENGETMGTNNSVLIPFLK